MKITELDLKEENGIYKIYECDNSIFKVGDGDSVDTERNTYLRNRNLSIHALLELDFEKIKGTKTPYERVDSGEMYYLVDRTGKVISFIDSYDYDTAMFNTVNYFNNKNYAEYIAFKETLMRKIDRFAWEHNAKVINWDNLSSKYYIAFDNYSKELKVFWAIRHKSNDIYFRSEEIARMALEKFKDDLVKLYSWEFDV